jgi:hypothetical protein
MLALLRLPRLLDIQEAFELELRGIRRHSHPRILEWHVYVSDLEIGITVCGRPTTMSHSQSYSFEITEIW